LGIQKNEEFDVGFLDFRSMERIWESFSIFEVYGKNPEN
jgi:hypothetical protein